MNYLKRCLCIAKAVRDFFRHGVWIPHVYRDTYEKAIIIATDHNFRVSENYEHTADETVHKDAYLIRSRCIYCGKEDLSWARDERYLDL